MRQFTLNLLSFFANLLWIYYRLREFTINSPFIAPIYFKFTIFFREFTMDLLSFARIYYKFTTFFAILVWIDYLFHETTLELILNSLSFFHIEEFSIYLMNLSWVHYLYREILFTNFISRIYYGSTIHFANSLSISRINFGLTIFFANWLSFFRE